MKKFLKTIFIYVLIVAGIICIANAMYLSTSKIYATEEKFQAVPYGIELCNLGSSHGEDAFIYDHVADKVCFNFSLSGQVLTYDQRILDYCRDRLAIGAQVIITVSPFSFYGVDEADEPTFLSKNMRYYIFLPKEYVKE